MLNLAAFQLFPYMFVLEPADVVNRSYFAYAWMPLRKLARLVITLSSLLTKWSGGLAVLYYPS